MSEPISVTSTSGDSGGASFRAVLSNRNFLYLWMAQLFSQLAQQMINYAVFLQVSDLTQASSTATAGIIICFTLPAVFFSAIAGVFVEHQSKKRMLVATNIGRGVLVLFYILTVAIPHLDAVFGLPILYINTLIFSTVSQFFAPAEAAMIPLIVKRDKLIAANSLFNLTLTASQLIGFVFLGPLLLRLVGYRFLYVVLFAFFALCAWLTWRLPDADAAAAEEETGDGMRAKLRFAWDELKEGWTFIRSDAALMIAIVYWSVAISVFFMMATLGPKFLQDVLHVDPTHLYFILVPGGIGLVAGVVLVGRFATERNRTVLINYGLLAAGIGLLLLALTYNTVHFVAGLIGSVPGPTTVSISQVIIGGLALFLGIFNSFISVPAQTVLQERAPEDIRARVFGAFYTVCNALLILPLVVAGAMADFIGVLPTMVIIAVLVLVVAGVGLAYQRAHQGILAGPGGDGPGPGLSGEPEALVPGTIAVEMPHIHPGGADRPPAPRP
ncbi:MAG TPA: MFS transporter [Chloroflexia bacterium]|nr:MFS transporter [Chloroflexia bacterium]